MFRARPPRLPQQRAGGETRRRLAQPCAAGRTPLGDRNSATPWGDMPTTLTVYVPYPPPPSCPKIRGFNLYIPAVTASQPMMVCPLRQFCRRLCVKPGRAMPNTTCSSSSSSKGGGPCQPFQAIWVGGKAACVVTDSTHPTSDLMC
jgi:hypothetical protein